ncbi:MAG: hypothetical protein RMN51_05995 [Verrucomicrobiota bacterium]|nr:hypothetical protein [Limisphaera sp.]MDW8381644.1 hypothetical protein [Verrucomicrobiota bacterium]
MIRLSPLQTKLRYVFALCIICLAAGGCLRPARSRPGPQAGPTLELQPALPQLSRPVVWMIGPVRRPVLHWRQDLTLAEAILEAEYLFEPDPRTILIRRGSIVIPIDPARLLQGEDFALLPGDQVEIRP